LTINGMRHNIHGSGLFVAHIECEREYISILQGKDDSQ